MARTIRVVALVLASALLLTGTAEARVHVVLREPFNGTGASLPPRWRDIDGQWRRVSGAARIKPATVSPVTNVAYSVRRLRSTYGKRGLLISSRIRLSPGFANVGVVGPFLDAKNHLFCKVEKSRANPDGLMAIGRRRNAHEPVLMAQERQLGLVAGGRYTLTIRRLRARVTCTLTQDGSRVGRVSYAMTAADRAAFGGGRKVGIRMRLVARGNRRDEDDGRSAFESFMAGTLS